MRHLRLLTVASTLCLAACAVDPAADDAATARLSASNLDEFSIELTDYDNVRVDHELGAVVESDVVRSAFLGVANDAEFLVLKEFAVTETGRPGVVSIDFSDGVRVDSTWISRQLTLRYVLEGEVIQDFTRDVDFYRYPYANAEVVVDMKVFAALPFSPSRAQDIALSGNVLYVHPFGPAGLLQYDLVTKSVDRIALYGSGDHLAADQGYVFCDVAGGKIQRYNIGLAKVDAEFSVPTATSLFGLETKNGALYAASSNSYFWELSYAGLVVDSSQWSLPGYYLTFNGETILTLFEGTDPAVLRQRDFSGVQTFPDLVAPMRSGAGVKKIGQFLYYCDYFKGIVGRVPIQDLIPVSD